MWVRNNKGNVFVGNLPPNFSDERLAETFDPYGIVLSAIVARDPDTGARLRYGFVDIATERAAAKAITALDGTEVDGCKLNVKASEKKAKAAGPKRTAGPRRQPLRPPPRRILSDEQGEAPARPRRVAQSAIAREQLEAIEPPPRRDFEVVVRRARRTTPSFQVERRSLPRRV